jgi:DNA-binding MarR family transcriptional regulator
MVLARVSETKDPILLRRRLQDHLSYVLADLGWRLNRELAASFRIEGVPVEYWRVLRALADAPGQSPTELADRVPANLPTLTKLIDRMVADALVYRLPDPNDGRRVRLHVADRGHALLERLDRQADAQQLELEQAIGAAELSELLTRLEALRATLGAGSSARRPQSSRRPSQAGAARIPGQDRLTGARRPRAGRPPN